jgi:hypothetical protein
MIELAAYAIAALLTMGLLCGIIAASLAVERWHRRNGRKRISEHGSNSPRPISILGRRSFLRTGLLDIGQKIRS